MQSFRQYIYNFLSCYFRLNASEVMAVEETVFAKSEASADYWPILVDVTSAVGSQKWASVPCQVLVCVDEVILPAAASKLCLCPFFIFLPLYAYYGVDNVLAVCG